MKEVVIRPMLAPSVPVTPEQVDLSRGPVWVSPKLDGVRNLQMNSVSKSRKLKDFPNLHTQKLFAHPILDGMDGELVVGNPTAPNAIQATTSGVMSIHGEPDVRYYLFDCWDSPKEGFLVRKAYVRRKILLILAVADLVVLDGLQPLQYMTVYLMDPHRPHRLAFRLRSHYLAQPPWS